MSNRAQPPKADTKSAVKRVILDAFPEGIHRHLGQFLQTGPQAIDVDALVDRIIAVTDGGEQ